MTSRLKIIGLALLAALTMAAWSAGAAHAELEFQALETIQYGESEEEQEDVPVPATLHATQVAGEPMRIGIGESKVQCTTATATGALPTGSSPTIDLAPSYSGCKLGALTTEVSTGGCSFDVDLLEEVEATQFSAQTDIVCPGGGQILATVKVLGKTACLIHVYAQTGLKPVKAITMTEDSPEDFTLKYEVNTLKATVEKGEVSCPVFPAEYTKVELTGNTLVTANSTGEKTPPAKVGPRPVKKIHFGVEEEEVQIRGSVAPFSPQVFGFDLGKVECEVGEAVQNIKSPTTKLSYVGFGPLAPNEYEKCKHPSGKKTEVLFKECGYELASGVVNKGVLTGGLRIASCGVSKMEVKIDEFCTILIPEQLGGGNMGLRRVTFQNAGNGKTSVIRANFQVARLKYEEKNGPGCQQPNVLKKNGTITGSLDFYAVEAGGENKQVGLWVAETP